MTTTQTIVFSPADDLIRAIANGDMVIIVDDEDRENEGDLVMAASAVTPEKIAFMLRHTSGIICTPIAGSRLDELDIPLMVSENTDAHRTAFTVSVDAARNVGNGHSAADRCTTIRTLLDPRSGPGDLARPGHVYPLRYEPGGVLRRSGHTEAAVDLALLAGLFPAGIISELMNDDGTVSRLPEIVRFAQAHGLLVGSIADLIAYRKERESLVQIVAADSVSTTHGYFRAYVFRSTVDNRDHLALVHGEVGDGDDVLVRVHSECLTGDVFGSLRCDCGEQLQLAMERIVAEGRGVVLYIRGHEGRGIGLLAKLAAYVLQDEGLDTFEANVVQGLPVDSRDFGIGAQILFGLGVRSMRLLTNNPRKRVAIEGHGLTILERVPLVTQRHSENSRYLTTKATRLGHYMACDHGGD